MPSILTLINHMWAKTFYKGESMSIRPSGVIFSISIVLGALQANLFAEQTFEELIADAPPIHRVEEDWEFVVANPDPTLDIPQVVTVFGPTNASFDTHTVFELNHGTLPSFGEGGMQLQVWFSDYLLGYYRHQAPTEFSTINEKVTYTTATSINGRYLHMEVINGNSITFGTFGTDNSLRARLYTNRDDLNPYHPNNSVKHSRVTFGANRVSYFRRNEIRFYDADGNLYAKSEDDVYIHLLQ
ncbi:hypothetical protein [Thalassoglobus sp.]|uniref:hypothetical protein n=1 Tax=Thalassoglobus sp. TaxID=2795869 RepID=UPI003AA81F78